MNQQQSTQQRKNLHPESVVCKIIEQPAKCALRFRYECEGRSAGSLPGASSTPENKTFPAIQIENYVGRAVVVISCVTKDQPYRPHPHNIVGKEGCKKGICTIVMNIERNTIKSFQNLGIQCVKRKDIEESLSLRESIKVDPFRSGFGHKRSASSIDLNVVRLCFQVFIESPGSNKCDFPIQPVVSDPIHDKKAMSDLVITKLSHCSAPATGGREVILLCDRISKDDVQIRFFQERDGDLIWEAYSEFSPADVHKQVAICFKTPKYFDENIQQPVMVKVQLKRASDNQVSESRLFQFLPCESDDDMISRKRQKIGSVNLDSFVIDNILQPRQQNNIMFNNIHPQSSNAAILQARSPTLLNQQQQQIVHNDNYPTNQFQIAPVNIDQGMLQVAMGSRHHSPSPQRAVLCRQQAIQTNTEQDNININLDQQCHQNQVDVNGSVQINRNVAPSFNDRLQYNDRLQQNYFNQSHGLIVKHEIIESNGKITQVVDREGNNQKINFKDNTQNDRLLVNQQPIALTTQKLDTLDRIDTDQLVPNMNFDTNMDFNLGSNLTFDINEYRQQESHLVLNQMSNNLNNKKETKFDSSNTLNTPQVSELDPRPFDNN